jgi:hypothetical protein
MVKTWRSKDPDEVVTYSYDWGPDLNPGEVIVGATATSPIPAGTTFDPATHDDTHVSILVSGGTDGEEATFLIHIETSANQEFEDSVVLPIAATISPEAYAGGYAVPTPGNLVAAFPEFGSVSGATIQTYLDRAARSVDESWTEGDFGFARMLLAAHFMTLAGLGATAAAEGFANGSDEFRAITSGSLRVERFDQSKGGGYMTTRYGRQFRDLLRANRGGARVTGGIGGGSGSGDNYGPWTWPT